MLFVSVTVIFYKHAEKGLALLMNSTLFCLASEPAYCSFPSQRKLFRCVEAYIGF